MLKPRHIVAAFCVMSLFSFWFAAAQEKPVETDLKLVTIGNGKTRTGVPTGFRVYEAADSGKGRVDYLEFKSLQIESESSQVVTKIEDLIRHQ